MNKRLLSALLITSIIFLPLFAVAQTSSSDEDEGSRQQQRPQFQFQNLPGETQYFVDEVGLSFLSDNVPSADYFDRTSYVIGPQDVVTVDIEGPVSLNARALVVNSNGYLFIPFGGSVNVSGLTIEEATEALTEAVSEELNDFDLSMTVQKPRPVTVQVVGDVPYPGRYILPAGSRLDFAIYAALFEGELPTENRNSARYQQQFLSTSNYSLRNITVNRQWLDQTTDGDLIAYFNEGDRTKNPYMYDGDQIRIRTINENTPRISISGAVQSEQELEFRRDDTVQSLLTLSGGYVDGADTTRVILYRETDNGVTSRKINLDDEPTDLSLQANDRLVVPYRSDVSRSSSAWVYGEATYPGNFPIQNDETTLAELVERAGGTTDEALPNGAYLIRSNMSDRNVASATTLNTQQLMRTSDQVQQGFEYLEMEQELNSDQRMFINLNNREQLQQIRVTDGDRLYIPKDYQNVLLYGQLNNPGNYSFSPDLSVSDYIEKAGGLSIAANPERIFIIKAGSRSWKQPGETSLESGDMIYVDRTPFDELNAQRNYDIQLRNLRQNNIQIILTTISTITAVVTTYVAITR